jgi:hypothetical protein
MTESLFYYFLAFNLAVVLVLACGIIAGDLRSRRQLLKWERTSAAYSELIGEQDHNSRAQRASNEPSEDDLAEEIDEHTLDRVKQFQSELNQQVIDLEKER